jgi:hypothetical protein
VGLCSDRTFREKILDVQRRQNEALAKQRQPAAWHHPMCLHVTIAAQTRTFKGSERRFSRLTRADLTQDHPKNKLGAEVRRAVDGNPEKLIGLVGSTIKAWHEDEKIGASVELTVKRPMLYRTNGHIVLPVECQPLERLADRFAEQGDGNELGKKPPSLHVTVGWLSPWKGAAKRAKSAKVGVSFSAEKETDTIVTKVGTILLAHYQSRTLAALHGSVRFSLAGTSAVDTSFNDLNIEW